MEWWRWASTMADSRQKWQAAIQYQQWCLSGSTRPSSSNQNEKTTQKERIVFHHACPRVSFSNASPRELLPHPPYFSIEVPMNYHVNRSEKNLKNLKNKFHFTSSLIFSSCSSIGGKWNSVVNWHIEHNSRKKLLTLLITCNRKIFVISTCYFNTK